MPPLSLSPSLLVTGCLCVCAILEPPILTIPLIPPETQPSCGSNERGGMAAEGTANGEGESVSCPRQDTC
jgi:hypothetical protein